MDADSEAGSQSAYLTPHGEAKVPSSRAEHTIEQEELNPDPEPQSKQQRVTENEL